MSEYDANYQAHFTHEKSWYSILFDEYGVPFGTATNPVIVSAGAAGSLAIEGIVDDDAAVGATKPIIGGGVYFVDPTADTLDDGDAGWVLLNDQRMQVVVVSGGSAGGGVEIEGVVDDDAAVGTTKPLVVGGVYIADPAADTLDDGDAGWALLNDQRMQVTESRAYDPVSDADKDIPVWSPPDLWSTEDLSDTATANGTTTKYVVMPPNSRWSIQFVPTEAAAEVITLTVAQSNEDDDDVSSLEYTDITDEFFGTSGFTAERWIEPELPTACKVLRVQVTVTGYTAGTSAWSALVTKRSNS